MSIFGDVSKRLLPVFLVTSMAVAGTDGVQADQAQDNGLSVVMRLSPVWVVAIGENKERIGAFVERQGNPNDLQVLAARLDKYNIEDDGKKLKLYITFNLGSLGPDKWVANGYVDCSYVRDNPSTKCLWIISPSVDSSPALEKGSQEKRPDDGLLNIQQFPIDSKQIDWTQVEQLRYLQDSDIVQYMVRQHSDVYMVLKGQIPSWLKMVR